MVWNWVHSTSWVQLRSYLKKKSSGSGFPTKIYYAFLLIWRILTMVCNTQNLWAFGICTLPSIVETRKQNVSKTGCVSIFRWGGRHFVGPLLKGLSQSLDLKRTQIASMSPLAWRQKHIKFLKHRILLISTKLEDVQSPKSKKLCEIKMSGKNWN
jgi:hypothetical protein